ncbi:glycosyltransferase family 4 protein [Pedobacter sp. R-06]|uniref:glycosyltransferase family 4 protein n=1 Tax=Pedobacter sp. R-06 TaxID=3404051 RepID=UPI003CEFFDF3
MVFYTLGVENKTDQVDSGFKRKISWDLPLLKGYNYTFIDNVAAKPGYYFKGIVNPGLITAIKNFNPNAILIYGWSYQSHLKAMKYFKNKVPIWFRGDSTLLDQFSIYKRLTRKLFLTWVYKHIDLAFFVGTENQKYFKAHGLKTEHLIFTPHAVDNDRFGQNRLSEALALRKDLSISSHDILILFAGKFEEKKDPLILLKAFVELNRPNTHLLFVGNGELEKILKIESKEQKAIGNRIHFMDFQNQSQMPVIYQACDLFCLPSKGPNETWGLAVNEAMAAGKAVLVSSKVGSATDLIFPAENGYIFKSADQRDLTEKLDIITNLQTLDLFGKKSKEIIQHWSFTEQVSVFIEKLYESIR